MSNKSFIWPKPPDSDFMHPEAEALGAFFPILRNLILNISTLAKNAPSLGFPQEA